MKSVLHPYCLVCFFFLASLCACESTKKTTSTHRSQPKFIDNVYIAGHNKSDVKADAINHHKRPERTKIASAPTATPSLKSVITSQDAPLANREPPGKDGINFSKDQKAVKKKYADILGIQPQDITNYSLYQFIDKWYGANYRLGGTDDEGIDCSAFAQRLYKDVYGMDLLRTAMDQFGTCKRIKHSGDAIEGDLVFFHIHSRRITHVGVYLANDYFIHASTSGGVMISNLNEDYWHKYYAGCGRVPKNESDRSASTQEQQQEERQN